MASEVGSGDPVPDTIPVAIFAELHEDVARLVRRRRRTVGLRRFTTRPSDVWFGAFIVFCVLVVALGLAGGLLYAIVVWPWAGLYVVAPAGVLFAWSLLIAARIRNRWADRGTW